MGIVSGLRLWRPSSKLDSYVLSPHTQTLMMINDLFSPNLRSLRDTY